MNHKSYDIMPIWFNYIVTREFCMNDKIQEVFLFLLLSFCLVCSSCSDMNLGPYSSIKDKQPIYEVYTNLNIKFNNLYLNGTIPDISVVGLPEGATLSLYGDECVNKLISTLNQDGSFSNIPELRGYQEKDYWLELKYEGEVLC